MNLEMKVKTKLIMDEAVKISRDYPYLTLEQVIDKAKEVIECVSLK